jgi:diguanylate cyclase (GGDEF)-like protein
MQNIPGIDDLRFSVLGTGRPFAVLGLSDCGVIKSDPGIELIRGLWDGKPALALISPPREDPDRCSHENDLKSLHEISFELSLCQCVDDLCREAVRLGLERLGFDRLGIWLIDRNDTRWKLGTWGTDESGRPRDERGARLLRKTGGIPASFYEGRLPLLFDDDEPCGDHEGRPVGPGSKLVAPLWDGHALIGEMGADDLIRHGGFSPERREVFVIFARVVANLISLKQAEAELRHLASTDSLTGTVNRRTALIILEKNIAQCLRSGSPLTICLSDLDGLKTVNDAYGHSKGDEYICKASSALVGAVRGADTVGRIGGDEFLLVFPDCRAEVVAGIMDRVNADLASGAKGRTYLPRLSWGTASLGELPDAKDPTDGPDLQRCIDILLELADQRMYDDKRTKGASRPRASGEAQLAF